jgi:hypothetical protein
MEVGQTEDGGKTRSSVFTRAQIVNRYFAVAFGIGLLIIPPSQWKSAREPTTPCK